MCICSISLAGRAEELANGVRLRDSTEIAGG